MEASFRHIAEKFINYIKTSYRTNTLAYWFVASSFAVYFIFEILSYRKFMFPMLDLGMYNRHMWGMVRLDFGINPLKGWNLLGDHAHFFLIFLTPFYLLCQSPVFLLFVQALFIALSGYPIYLIAKRYFRDESFALIWLIPYFLYFGFWSALAYPFHVSPIAVLPMSWAMYFLLERKYTKLLYILPFLVLVKEDMPLFLIMMGMYLIIVDKKFLFGSLLMFFSGIYFLIITKYWLPMVSGINYYYSSTIMGDSMIDTLINIFLHPILFIKNMILPYELKGQTITLMMMSFGGILPLFAPQIFILISPLWVGRFLNEQAFRWSYIQHYSANQGPILMIAAIIGASYIISLFKDRKKPLIILTSIVLVGSFLVHSRISKGENYFDRFMDFSFYILNDNDRSAWKAINMIPPDSSVAAQSAFPQVSGRKNIYHLPIDLNKTKPDYLLISENYDMWPFKNKADLNDFTKEAVNDFNYKIIFDENGTRLLKR